MVAHLIHVHWATSISSQSLLAHGNCSVLSMTFVTMMTSVVSVTGLLACSDLAWASSRSFMYLVIPSPSRWYPYISFWSVRILRAWSTPHVAWRWVSSFPTVTSLVALILFGDVPI